MTHLAIASSSQIAADAGAEMAEVGGNAVDAAIAASLVQLVTEPGVVSDEPGFHDGAGISEVEPWSWSQRNCP